MKISAQAQGTAPERGVHCLVDIRSQCVGHRAHAHSPCLSFAQRKRERERTRDSAPRFISACLFVGCWLCVGMFCIPPMPGWCKAHNRERNPPSRPMNKPTGAVMLWTRQGNSRLRSQHPGPGTSPPPKGGPPGFGHEATRLCCGLY